MKNCPKCRVQHFDGVDECECGYRFSTNRVDPNIQASASGRDKPLRGWLATGAILLLMVILGSFIGKTVGGKAASTVNKLSPASKQTQSEQASTKPETPLEIKPLQKIQTFVVRQAAEGYGAEDLNSESLQKLESYLVDRSVERAQEIMKAQGQDSTSVTKDIFITSSHLIELDNQKLGVVYIVSTPIKIKMVLAFRNNELVRVNCVLQGDGEIPLTWGPCAKQVETTFNVQFPKVNRN